MAKTLESLFAYLDHMRMEANAAKDEALRLAQAFEEIEEMGLKAVTLMEALRAKTENKQPS